MMNLSGKTSKFFVPVQAVICQTSGCKVISIIFSRRHSDGMSCSTWLEKKMDLIQSLENGGQKTSYPQVCITLLAKQQISLTSRDLSSDLHHPFIKATNFIDFK